MSGFNSRLRRGYPRRFDPWSADEEQAFSRFATANKLAEALTGNEQEVAEARWAMATILHTRRHLRDWLGPLETFMSRSADIVWVGSVRTLQGDFRRLKRLLDAPDAELPSDPTEAHRTPEEFERR